MLSKLYGFSICRLSSSNSCRVGGHSAKTLNRFLIAQWPVLRGSGSRPRPSEWRQSNFRAWAHRPPRSRAARIALANRGQGVEVALLAGRRTTISRSNSPGSLSRSSAAATSAHKNHFGRVELQAASDIPLGSRRVVVDDEIRGFFISGTCVHGKQCALEIGRFSLGRVNVNGPVSCWCQLAALASTRGPCVSGIRAGSDRFGHLGPTGSLPGLGNMPMVSPSCS